MRFPRALFLASISACAHAAPAPVSTGGETAKNSRSSTPNTTSSESASPSGAQASAPTASASTETEPPHPKVVLHTGDSMVGFYAGLEKALGPHFEELGAKYVQDATTSAAIVTFDHSDHFAKMLATHDPDLVLITLGANDVFLPAPQMVAKNVASIAKKTAGRRCFWIGPPIWKKDTGIVDVIRQNCAPCTFYDSSSLKLERRADGIHPDDKGGATWADAFWNFYVKER